jgi:hypothetical protein
MRGFVCFIGILVLCSVENLYAQSDEELVLQAIQKFFNAMEEKDTVAMKEVLLMDGQFYSVRGEPEDLIIGRTTHKTYLEKLGDTKDDFRETMNSPMVHIHGRIAVVWTSYDFFRNEKFSHTGVDAFSLIKTKAGWKIAGTIYTVETRE